MDMMQKLFLDLVLFRYTYFSIKVLKASRT